MKKLIFAALAALAVIASSCYEDKGNYDYKNVNPIDSIKFHWSSDGYANLSIGDTSHLVAYVKFSNPNENRDDWKYIWKLNNEQVAEGLEYDYIPTKKGTDYLQFYAEHKESGVRYYLSHPALSVFSGAYIAITINSPFYAGGWHILSKKDNNTSCIDVLLRQSEYIYIFEEDENGEYVLDENGEPIAIDWWQRFFYKEYLDAYKSMAGEELGTNPVRMYNYYPVASNAGPEILLFQGNNNDGAVFLDKEDLHKVLTLQEEFENDEYPNGAHVTDFFYGGSMNMATTSDGKLYTVIMGRNGGSSNINAFSHLVNFLSTPLELGEGSFAKRFLSHEACINNTYSIVVYDSGLNTYRFFYTAQNSGTADHGKPIVGSAITLKDLSKATVPADEYFKRPNVLGDYEVLDWRFMNGKPTAGPHYIMAIKKHKTTGALVYDYFTYRGQSSKKIQIEIFEENVPMPEGVTENMWASNRVNKYFWYAVGNKIMFYDPTPSVKASYHYTTADSEITTLTVGPASDTRQKNQLAVGFANKKVVFYNIDNLVLQTAATLGDAKEYGDKGMGDSYIYWETTATGVPMQIKARHKSFNQDNNNKID